jgi:hypothetical protein
MAAYCGECGKLLKENEEDILVCIDCAIGTVQLPCDQMGLPGKKVVNGGK